MLGNSARFFFFHKPPAKVVVAAATPVVNFSAQAPTVVLSNSVVAATTPVLNFTTPSPGAVTPLVIEAPSGVTLESAPQEPVVDASIVVEATTPDLELASVEPSVSQELVVVVDTSEAVEFAASSGELLRSNSVTLAEVTVDFVALAVTPVNSINLEVGTTQLDFVSVEPTVDLLITVEPATVQLDFVSVEPTVDLLITVEPATVQLDFVSVEPTVDLLITVEPATVQLDFVSVEPTVDLLITVEPATVQLDFVSVEPTVDLLITVEPATVQLDFVSVEPTVDLLITVVPEVGVELEFVAVDPAVSQALTLAIVAPAEFAFVVGSGDPVKSNTITPAEVTVDFTPIAVTPVGALTLEAETAELEFVVVGGGADTAITLEASIPTIEFAGGSAVAIRAITLTVASVAGVEFAAEEVTVDNGITLIPDPAILAFDPQSATTSTPLTLPVAATPTIEFMVQTADVGGSTDIVIASTPSINFEASADFDLRLNSLGVQATIGPGDSDDDVYSIAQTSPAFFSNTPTLKWGAGNDPLGGSPALFSGGLRFSLAVPAGANIETAVIRHFLNTDPTTVDHNWSITLYAFLEGDAEPFDNGDPSTWPDAVLANPTIASSTITWSDLTPGENQWDVTAIVQEVVNQLGIDPWSSGNHIRFGSIVNYQTDSGTNLIETGAQGVGTTIPWPTALEVFYTQTRTYEGEAVLNFSVQTLDDANVIRALAVESEIEGIAFAPQIGVVLTPKTEEISDAVVVDLQPQAPVLAASNDLTADTPTIQLDAVDPEEPVLELTVTAEQTVIDFISVDPMVIVEGTVTADLTAVQFVVEPPQLVTANTITLDSIATIEFEVEAGPTSGSSLTLAPTTPTIAFLVAALTPTVSTTKLVAVTDTPAIETQPQAPALLIVSDIAVPEVTVDFNAVDPGTNTPLIVEVGAPQELELQAQPPTLSFENTFEPESENLGFSVLDAPIVVTTKLEIIPDPVTLNFEVMTQSPENFRVFTTEPVVVDFVAISGVSVTNGLSLLPDPAGIGFNPLAPATLVPVSLSLGAFATISFVPLPISFTDVTWFDTHNIHPSENVTRMLSIDMKLRKILTPDTTIEGINLPSDQRSHLLIIEAEDSDGEAYNIFVYQREVMDNDPDSGHDAIAYHWTNVASPYDLQEIPEGIPEDTDIPMFRYHTVEIVLRSMAEADFVWQSVKSDVASLVRHQNLLLTPPTGVNQTEEVEIV